MIFDPDDPGTVILVCIVAALAIWAIYMFATNWVSL